MISTIVAFVIGAGAGVAGYIYKDVIKSKVQSLFKKKVTVVVVSQEPAAPVGADAVPSDAKPGEPNLFSPQAPK